MNRIFIVGFARSGTSLLHSIVAAYPEVTGFTESSYYFHKFVNPFERLPFPPLLSDRIYVPRLFESSNMTQILDEFYRENNISSSQFSNNDFILMLDIKSKEMGSDTWVEKSTVHLRRIPIISKRTPEAKFIHIIRRFSTVQKSWQNARVKLNLDFFDAPEKKILRYWKRDLIRTVQYVAKDDAHHMAISYESLCNDTESVISRISNFIGKSATYDYIMNKRINTDVVLDRENWKNNVRSDILPASGGDLCDDDLEAEKFYKGVVNVLLKC